jgi:hypothetical protein
MKEFAALLDRDRTVLRVGGTRPVGAGRRLHVGRIDEGTGRGVDDGELSSDREEDAIRVGRPGDVLGANPLRPGGRPKVAVAEARSGSARMTSPTSSPLATRLSASWPASSAKRS